MSNNKILYGLYRVGYRDRMTGLGFRGLASTILNENGFEEAHIELQLAHMKRNKVAAAYNHAKYLKQRAAMMQWWADYLDAQLAKGEERNSSSTRRRTAIPPQMARVNLRGRVTLPIFTHPHAPNPTASHQTHPRRRPTGP